MLVTRLRINGRRGARRDKSEEGFGTAAQRQLHVKGQIKATKIRKLILHQAAAYPYSAAAIKHPHSALSNYSSALFLLVQRVLRWCRWSRLREEWPADEA